MKPTISRTIGSVMRSVADWAAPSISASPRTRIALAFAASDDLTSVDVDSDFDDVGRATPLDFSEDADETEIITVWFPLTDATVENGCLAVVPRHDDVEARDQVLVEFAEVRPFAQRRGDFVEYRRRHEQIHEIRIELCPATTHQLLHREGQADVADPVHDERLLGGSGRCRCSSRFSGDARTDTRTKWWTIDFGFGSGGT